MSDYIHYDARVHIKSFFGVYKGEKPFCDDNVTFDNIEIIQNTLLFSTYAHNRANEKQIKQGRL